MGSIRPCRDDERAAILAVINSAAEAYRGVIPADRWHEPYMPLDELDSEIAVGVAFWGYEADNALLGIMGIQRVRDVDLIRHAYVSPGSQRHGVGGALLEHLARSTTRRMLVGTWAAADWAIRFYRRHGFEMVDAELKAELLKTYWTLPERQIETSVVLAKPPLSGGGGIRTPSNSQSCHASVNRVTGWRLPLARCVRLSARATRPPPERSRPSPRWASTSRSRSLSPRRTIL